MSEKIKIFLNNGFKFQGERIEGEQGMITILDSRDHKKRSFPLTSITNIEELS